MPETVWWGEAVAFVGAVVGIVYALRVLLRAGRLLRLLYRSGHRGARDWTAAGGILLRGGAVLACLSLWLVLAAWAMTRPQGTLSVVSVVSTLALIGQELLVVLIIVDDEHRWNHMRRQPALPPAELPRLDP